MTRIDIEVTRFDDEVVKCRDGEQKTIILGNGFGQSYDLALGENNFGWNNLVELCDIDQDTPIYSLLEQRNFDFELAHRMLNNAIDVISKYDSENDLIKKLQEQVQYLRDQLVIAVKNSHPPSFHSNNRSSEEQKILGKMVQTCRNFLDKFDYVFSLNYDLLLYWVRCFERGILGEDSFRKDDDNLVFRIDAENSSSPLFLFPHGALFLYRDGAGALKLRSDPNNPILAQVEREIRKGHFPMCISEGTGEQKLDAIKSNSYLDFAYNQLKKCSGTIFTFGCSFQEEKDNHIIKALLESRATKIVIGAFRPNNTNFYRLKSTFEKLRHEFNNKEVVIADTDGVALWKTLDS